MSGVFWTQCELVKGSNRGRCVSELSRIDCRKGSPTAKVAGEEGGKEGSSSHVSTVTTTRPE